MSIPEIRAPKLAPIGSMFTGLLVRVVIAVVYHRRHRVGNRVSVAAKLWLSFKPARREVSMTNPIPYNPTREALFRPAGGADLFTHHPYPSTAALCAELSRFVYYGRGGHIDQAKLRRFLHGVFDLRAVADVMNSQAFLVEDEHKLIMVFRGTESDDFRDLITDIDVRPQNWSVEGKPAGRVHRGFASALDLVLPVLRAALGEVSKPLVLTGHSLGAAMATLAASQLQPSGLYTFGQPRVGNTEFASWMDRQVEAGLIYHRYVNCCDIATRVPPGFVGFRHAGVLHYIDREGQIHMAPDDATIAGDRSKARRQYWKSYSLGRGNVALRDLADHAPINYLSALLGRRSSNVPDNNR